MAAGRDAGGKRNFRVGAVFPQTEIGTDPGAIANFAQAIESLGFDDLVAYDHVVGANPASRSEWKFLYTHESMFHEPLVLFSYLAGVTRDLHFTTGVIILPQRQTALFGKQAANLDIFCNGRLRVGVGVGYTQLEYDALGVPFSSRAARMDDQIPLLRQLWTEASITRSGPFHTITDAGISPLPRQRPIPIWIGGTSTAAMRRAAKIGDGWLPYLAGGTEKAPSGIMFEEAEEKFSEFRQLVVDSERPVDAVPIETIVFLRNVNGGVDGLTNYVRILGKAGGSGIFVDTMHMGFQGADGHLAALRQIADRLELQPAAKNKQKLRNQ